MRKRRFSMFSAWGLLPPKEYFVGMWVLGITSVIFGKQEKEKVLTKAAERENETLVLLNIVFF